MPDTPESTCPNCGETRSGVFCAKCGQNNRRERLDAREMAGTALDSFVELDVPLFRTVVGLTLRPGATIRAYVGGQRRRFTNPVKYCLLTLTLVVLVLVVADISVTERMVEMFGGRPADATVSQGRIVERSLTYVALIAMPVIAVALWVTSLRRFNYTENLVFAMYAFGHAFLLSAVLTSLGAYSHPAFFAVQELGSMAYITWAAKGFYGGSIFRAAGRAVAAYLTYLACSMIFGSALIAAVITWRIITQ